MCARGPAATAASLANAMMRGGELRGASTLLRARDPGELQRPRRARRPGRELPGRPADPLRTHGEPLSPGAVGAATGDGGGHAAGGAGRVADGLPLLRA